MSRADGIAATEGLRFERKFLLDGVSPAWVVARLRVHPAVLRERYPPRYVNNLYFDSPGRRSYLEAVDGVPERRKIRIRWYGELFGAIQKAQLEIKLKRGYLGRKLSWPIAPFRLDPGFDRERLEGALADSDLPPAARVALQGEELALLNRYHRRYYESARARHRVTLDTGLEFYRVGPWTNPFVCRSAPRGLVVVELKYGPGAEEAARAFTEHFPVRLTKSSKYVLGVEGLGA